MSAIALDFNGSRLPDTAVTWESRHPDIAAISASGLLTGSRAGLDDDHRDDRRRARNGSHHGPGTDRFSQAGSNPGHHRRGRGGVVGR